MNSLADESIVHINVQSNVVPLVNKIDASSNACNTSNITTKRNRCFVCNKKVGLLGFECKCNTNAVFCSTHRYFNEHGCTLNVKETYQELLKKQNQVVVAPKINQI